MGLNDNERYDFIDNLYGSNTSQYNNESNHLYNQYFDNRHVDLGYSLEYD
jgi:hypothetical protein